jgi:small multidrug resistance pump
VSPYVYLSLAVIAEVVATTALKASEMFARPVPTILTVVGYVIAFYCLSLALRTIPVGVAYAVWSGAGILLIAAIGALWFGERLDGPAVLGLILIVAGVFVTRVFSQSLAG